MTKETDQKAIEPAEPTRTLADADTEIAKLNDKVAQLELDAEAAKAAHETEVADLRAKLAAAEQASADIMAGRKPREADENGNVEVRVKTPMMIHPSVPADYDPAMDGPIPESFKLVGGGALNYAPRWVAEHPLVVANAAEE